MSIALRALAASLAGHWDQSLQSPTLPVIYTQQMVFIRISASPLLRSRQNKAPVHFMKTCLETGRRVQPPLKGLYLDVIQPRDENKEEC